jgi:dipeptidyl-peptidase-4
MHTARYKPPIAMFLALICSITLPFACGSQQSTRRKVHPTRAATQTLANTDFLERYAKTNRFRNGQPTAIKVAPDGSAVYFLRSQHADTRNQDLWIFDTATRSERVLLTAESLLAGAEENLTTEEIARRERARLSARGIASFQISKDGSKFLVPLSGNVYVVDRGSALTGKPAVITLANEGPATASPIDPQLSPDATMVASVHAGSVVVRTIAAEPAAQSPLRISPESSGTVSYGEAEFVAQEEMGRSQGFWWSPDSRAIVYQSTDTKNVETFTIADVSNPATPAHAWPYPRAGKANADVRLFINSVHPGSIPVEILWDRGTYPYLAKVLWNKHGPLTLLVQNRTQTRQLLLAADPATGSTRTLLEEADPTWINIHDDAPYFLADGSFLWLTEQPQTPASRRDGWTLQHRNADGSLRRTTANCDSGLNIIGLFGVDEELGLAIINDAEHYPGSSVVACPLDPARGTFTEPGCIGEIGQVSATLGNGLSTWVRSTLSTTDEPRWEVMRGNQVLGNIRNAGENPPIELNLEMTKVSTPDGLELHAAIVRPSAFVQGRKYPVLNFAYAGPGFNTVHANRRQYLLSQWFADQGFIVVTTDGRGTPRRGRAWERAIKNNLIDTQLRDQSQALLTLCDRYPEMDRARIGVNGWSFGGYFSAMAAMRTPGVFRCGVAGAPVADWRDYDTHYTERFMGLPDPADKQTDGVPGNQAGYDASSVLTYCKDLTVPLLVIHGTADDNVYFTHSARTTDALFRAGKTFEFLPLAGQTHGVSEPQLVRRVQERIARFFLDNL